jgi:CYTH domain-containing protein
MNCQPSLVKDLVLPIATFSLSVAVGIVAWQQWRVARNKLRLDLFDRRYKVYNATRAFLSLVLDNAVTEEKLAEFNLATSDAEFLFGDDVVQFLTQIRQRATNLLSLKIPDKFTILPARIAEEMELRAASKQQDLRWLGEQITETTKVFGRYLGFAGVK